MKRAGFILALVGSVAATFAAPVDYGRDVKPIFAEHCYRCHGPDRLGTANGVPLLHEASDPANNIVAGTARFDAPTIRTVLGAGKGRMPAFPHLTPQDVDALVTFLTAAPGGRVAISVATKTSRKSAKS